MGKIALPFIKTALVSLTGFAACLILFVFIYNQSIHLDKSTEDLTNFFHLVLLKGCMIIWATTTLASLFSHFIKQDHARIPIFWSCAYLPVTYGLIRVLIEMI